jgi:hypothetical protein
MRDFVLSSMVRIKKLKQFFHVRGINEIWEWDTLKWHWISPNEGAYESSIDFEGHSSDCGLQRETALLILDYLHESMKITDQPGINNA